jgi:hypothetical protein
MKNHDEYFKQLQKEWSKTWVKSGVTCGGESVSKLQKERTQKRFAYLKACKAQALR